MRSTPLAENVTLLQSLTLIARVFLGQLVYAIQPRLPDWFDLERVLFTACPWLYLILY